MHIIQSGRSSAANRSAVRTSDFLASRVDQGRFKYIDVSNQPKRYPIDLGNGQIVFSETYRTAAEYLAAGRAEISKSIEVGRERRKSSVLNEMQKACRPVRVPLFDRRRVEGQDKLSQLNKLEMQKAEVL